MERTRSRLPLLGILPALAVVVWLAATGLDAGSGSFHGSGLGLVPGAGSGSGSVRKGLRSSGGFSRPAPGDDSLRIALVARLSEMPYRPAPGLQTRGATRIPRSGRSDAPSDWQTWYRHNAAPIEDLKATLYAPIQSSGCVLYLGGR